MSARVIWKFPLGMNGGDLLMPTGAVVRHVGVQRRETVCLWAEVDPTSPLETRTFVPVGTGHPWSTADPEHLAYVGTTIHMDDQLVLHWHELTSREPGS